MTQTPRKRSSVYAGLQPKPLWKDPAESSEYIQKLEKRQKEVTARYKKVIEELGGIEPRYQALMTEKTQLFHEYHDLRQRIEVEVETGFPHGLKKK